MDFCSLSPAKSCPKEPLITAGKCFRESYHKLLFCDYLDNALFVRQLEVLNKQLSSS